MNLNKKIAQKRRIQGIATRAINNVAKILEADIEVSDRLIMITEVVIHSQSLIQTEINEDK